MLRSGTTTIRNAMTWPNSAPNNVKTSRILWWCRVQIGHTCHTSPYFRWKHGSPQDTQTRPRCTNRILKGWTTPLGCAQHYLSWNQKKATGKLPPGKAFFCWRCWLPTVRESRVWLALRKVTVDIQREAATSKIDPNRSNSTTSIVEVQGLNTRGECNGKTLVSNAIGKTFVVLCCNQQRNSGGLGPLPLQLLLLTPKLTI